MFLYGVINCIWRAMPNRHLVCWLSFGISLAKSLLYTQNQINESANKICLRTTKTEQKYACQKRNHTESLAPIGQTPITPQSMVILPPLFRRNFLLNAF